MLRGIANTTGTACHVNAALIVLGHALRPVSNGIILVASSSEDTDETTSFRCMLGSFLRELMQDNADVGKDDNTLRRIEGDTSFASHDTIIDAASAPLDPTSLFTTLRTTLRIEAHDLGDAVTALIKLLQHIIVPGGNMSPLLSSTTNMLRQQQLLLLHDKLLYSGRVYSVLSGHKSSSSQTSSEDCTSEDTRTKRLKERRLVNPYPLSLHRHHHGDDCNEDKVAEWTCTRTSLPDLLHEAFGTNQEVEGYKWPSTSVDNDPDGNAAYQWTTTKRLHVVAFPPIFMMHLQRPELVSGTSHSSKSCSFQATHSSDRSSIDIPLSLSLDEYISPFDRLYESEVEAPLDEHQYQLMGGILHVSDDPAELEEGEEDGHYVAVVCLHNQWYLVDDDHVCLVSVDQVLSWLGGGSYDCHPQSSTEYATHLSQNSAASLIENMERQPRLKSGSYLRGVLLVYHRDGVHSMAEAILQTMRSYIDEQKVNPKGTGSSLHSDSQSAAAVPDEKPGEHDVGRRLRVLWSGGTYYAGTVTKYNTDSGKHTITYDDGDVRMYKLSKKTIEWLE